jgi:hypothetical protein
LDSQRRAKDAALERAARKRAERTETHRR